jgi:serpin B
MMALAAAGLAGGGEKQARPDLKAVVQGNTEFALDLYAQLRDREGNLFLSPYSISTALSMTYAGARGDTADEMARALHLSPDQEHLHPAVAELIQAINPRAGQKRAYQLNVANALWGQKNFGFLPDFLNLTRRDYGAGLHEVDFERATEEARRTINAWVENETKNKIKDLLPRGVVTVDTRLVLTNAIYFKGLWRHPFHKSETRNEAFKTSATDSVKAPLMHQKAHFKYLGEKNFQALELAYGKDGDLSMVVLLPTKVDGLAEFEKKLTAAHLAEWLGKLRTDEVNVTLPRFKMTREFSLKQALEALGMRKAFVPGRADFTGMSGSGRKLFIQAVVHKAFVDVNEEGTEAAAATGVVVGLASARIPPTPVFRADHPFLFMIRHNRTGSILFMGRVTNPV